MSPAAKKIFIRLLMAAACLVLLGLVVFVAWRIRLANDIDRQLAAIRAAGLPTNGKELNDYYPAVPDDENAALVMTQAFSLLRNYPYGQSNEVAHFKIPPRGQ